MKIQSKYTILYLATSVAIMVRCVHVEKYKEIRWGIFLGLLPITKHITKSSNYSYGVEN